MAPPSARPEHGRRDELSVLSHGAETACAAGKKLIGPSHVMSAAGDAHVGGGGQFSDKSHSVLSSSS